MQTYLIIHTKEKHFTRGFTETFDLGHLTGKQAKDATTKMAASYHILPEDLCWTPKCIGGVRFYIGVVR